MLFPWQQNILFSGSGITIIILIYFLCSNTTILKRIRRSQHPYFSLKKFCACDPMQTPTMKFTCVRMRNQIRCIYFASKRKGEIYSRNKPIEKALNILQNSDGRAAYSCSALLFNQWYFMHRYMATVHIIETFLFAFFYVMQNVMRISSGVLQLYFVWKLDGKKLIISVT